MKKEPTKHHALLDLDVRSAFPDDASVNDALRVILKAAQALADRSIPTQTKRRKRRNEKKKNCRVLAMSGGKLLYETPILSSAPRSAKRIISHQRGLLMNKHPTLKSAKNVEYVLQWLEDDRWVTDKG